jgi:hypothetical protein
MASMMSGMKMQELTSEELEGASGGNGQACANAMLFWGGVGSGVGAIVGGGLGGIGGGLLGFSAGAAVGGGLAARYATVCMK